MDVLTIQLRVPIVTCTRCNHPYVPTHNNEECLLCIRGIPRWKLEKCEYIIYDINESDQDI